MNRVVFALLLAVAIVLEARLRVGGVSPNLTLIFVYYIGLRRGPSGGLLAGAGLGMLSDILAGSIIGPNLMGKCTAGYMSGFLKGGWLFTWTPLLGLIGIVVLTAVDGVVSYAFLSIFTQHSVAGSAAALTILWQSAFNSIFGLFLKAGDED